MMNERIRVWAWVAVVLLCVFMCSHAKAYTYQEVNPATNPLHGTNGQNVSWSYDPSTQRLTYTAYITANDGSWMTFSLGNVPHYGSSGYSTGYDPNHVIFDQSPPSGQTFTGSYAVPAGTWLQIACRNNGSGGVLSDQVEYWQAPSAPNKSVTVNIPINTGSTTLRYRLVDANGAQIGNDVEVAPGQGMSQTFSVPASTPGPLTLVYQVEGYNFDGAQWVAAPAGSAFMQATASGGAVSIPTTDSTATTATLDAPKAVPKGTGQESQNGGFVWKSDGTSATAGNATLSNQVFREGSDKLASAITDLKASIDGDGTPAGNVTTFDQTASADYATTASSSSAVGVVTKLPDAPKITAPSRVATYSWTITVPNSDQTYHIDWDLSQWDTQIQVFRALVTAALTIAFFFMAVKAIKEAFA